MNIETEITPPEVDEEGDGDDRSARIACHVIGSDEVSYAPCAPRRGQEGGVVTALAAALHAAGHATPAAMPTRRATPAELDPQTTFTYWHHTCPADGCKAWVPNHLPTCTRHEETP